MDVRTVHDFFPQTGPDWPIAFFLAKLPPVPPGDHRLGSCPFTVVPRNTPASKP
jgi:hypothetical protein